MTILGILFVLGVAFLASMNFEADLIASETQRHRAESRVTAVVDQLGSTLRDGLMSAARTPFGDPSTALSPTAFAEMPGVQNSFSPIEPYRDDKGTPVLSDDQILYRWFTDPQALKRRPFAGPTYPMLEIDTKIAPGTTGIPGDPVFLDADGDGIADSLQVDAKVLGFSDAQLAALSARLNPPTNPTGKVFVGIRVIPHGGLVNLNASHPKLIENVLDVPDLRVTPNPVEYGNFIHRPTKYQGAYSPLLEEPSLRRRGFLAPRAMPPSWLHGDPLLNPVTSPSGKADMQWQLFPPVHPGGAARGLYETVFKHRYWAFNPSVDPSDPDAEWYDPRLTDLGTLWDVRMEPFTADAADGATDGFMPEYDRRHLVTTVSHDDLLARGGRVVNPAVPGGDEDILAKMTQANQTAHDPDVCPALLPFEYSRYPDTISDDCCPADLGCRLNARKGRLQLSLPWLDERITEAYSLSDSTNDEKWEKDKAFERVYRLIHDTFFLLVRNAAHLTTLEGTPCVKRCLAGTYQGMLCDLNADCPGSICESVDCLYANGACGRNGKCKLAASPTPFLGCASYADCSIPGSRCRADGVCTIQAPYWQDVQCPPATACAAGEVCNTTLGLCVDAWTGQTHTQALISRTAASLTANFLDYADTDDVPTRVALRSMDFAPGMCITGPNTGGACGIDADCGPGGLCSPPQRVCITTKYRTPLDKVLGRTGDFPIAPPIKCRTYADCSTGDYCAFGALQSAGREFHLGVSPGGAPDILQPTYVYGLERQPYITEVATLAKPGAPPNPPTFIARAVELFNPYDTAIDAKNQYFVYEVNGSTVNKIALDGVLQPNSGPNPKPFTSFATGNPAALTELVGTPTNGTSNELKGAKALTFEKGWTLYLVRRVQYDGTTTDIAVDQFEVKGGNIADPAACLGPDHCKTSLQRVVAPTTPWTATVPKPEPKDGSATLGDWNNAAGPEIHPVEVNFADLGSFSRPFENLATPTDPRIGSVSFPTTGSLLMLMRHANRSFDDRNAPGGTVNDLAFTTHLIGDTSIPNPAGGAPLVTFSAEQQIDNGRMPVFDPPKLGGTNWYSADHLAPFVTQLGAPGNLDTLPWGQLVFDYFTALPLSNPGPYFVHPVKVAAPDSLPRVDLDGLRVHGRININAAPWKVLAGLPFVPMKRVPTLTQCAVEPCPVSFRDRIRSMLPGDPSTGQTYAQLFADDQAGTIGNPLAQAIVAYRELRPVGGSGNYADGIPLAGTPPSIAYARGWNPTPPVVPPMARRGTGFMTVGELANVRHLGITNPLYRIDSGVMGVDPNNANNENFVDAVAALVALGDWVTVRSQVFTVYGVLRGEEDDGIKNSGLPTAAIDAARDVDSRALRFQETIDRLPTFLGAPVPSRIGDRTLTRYTDAHND
jgi:hypothetical protein